ncbi:MAG TPA: hypothetical protein VF331_23605 [Polyangiales bacterium]
MKAFARAGGRLRTLPFQARLVYSIFLVFTLVALALTAWLGAEMVGADLSHVDEYYAGGKSPAQPNPGPAEPGPKLDLPDEALAQPVADPMPTRKLLEVTHFHLFSMPVYLVILSHLFMLGSWSMRSKTFWIGAGSVAVALHIAAPWLARSAAAGSRLLYGMSGGLLALSFLVMSFVPLIEMWKPARGRPESNPPPT